MVTLCGIKRSLLCVLLLGLALLIGMTDMPSSAQIRSPEQGQVPGTEVLVAGAGSIANATSPAEITIDLGKEPTKQGAKLELALEPVSADARYLISVSVKSPSGEKRLGTVSFNSQRPGIAQIFYFDALPIIREAQANGTDRVNLSVAVVLPDSSGTPKEASLRVVGARLV